MAAPSSSATTKPTDGTTTDKLTPAQEVKKEAEEAAESKAEAAAAQKDAKRAATPAASAESPAAAATPAASAESPAAAPTPAADAPTPGAESTTEDEAASEESPEAVIDEETFMQIIDLDEDDTHEFSKGMAWAYFSQVDTTFKEMDDAVNVKDLPKLSSLGHFLKGSSAALGVAKVQLSCEQIQHYGAKRDEDHNKDLSADEALELIRTTLKRVKGEYAVAEKWLRKWYREHGGDEEPPK